MAGKETVEEKIARIVRETMGAERQRAEDEKDPNIGRLRRIIGEEVRGVLEELLSDPGDAEGAPNRRRSRNRRPTDDGDEEEGGSLAKILGL